MASGIAIYKVCNKWFKLLLGVCAVVLMAGCDSLVKLSEEAALAKAQKEQPALAVGPALEPSYVRATGYAPISLQSGQTKEHKVLQAMRASRLNAYQELAAIVHGQYVFGGASVQEMVLQNDQFKTAVAGIIRGAQTVKSYPVNDDVYATILEVDMNQLQRAWIAAE